MTILKMINAGKCTGSYSASLILGRPVCIGMPTFVSIEVTNKCNLHCPECASGSGIMKRARGYMDPIFFSEIMKQMRKSLLGCNLYFQGEPLLHPDFPEFLRNTPQIFKTISTNGHFLTSHLSEEIIKSGHGKIIVSMDGLDQDTYSMYRKNGDLEKVKEGIGNISAAKKKFRSDFRIEVQMLVNRFNEKQVAEFRKFAKKMGVVPVLKSMQICDKDAFNFWLPAEERFRRYRKSGGEFRIKSQMPNRCSRLWFIPVITWDGKVLPCCFDKDASYVMGDLKESTFSKIWKGERFQNFRRDVLAGRNNIDICRNCTSGLNLLKK